MATDTEPPSSTSLCSQSSPSLSAFQPTLQSSKILLQGNIVARGRRPSRHHHNAYTWQQFPSAPTKHFSNLPLDSIPHDRIPNTTTHRHAKPRGTIFRILTEKNEPMRHKLSSMPHDVEVFAPLRETNILGKRFAAFFHHPNSRPPPPPGKNTRSLLVRGWRQPPAALLTPPTQHIPAARCLHSPPKPMGPRPTRPMRLICPFHYCSPFLRTR